MSTPAAEPEGMETPAKPRPKRASATPANPRPAARATKRKRVPAQSVRVESMPVWLAARLVAVGVAAAAGIFLLIGGENGTNPVPNATPGVITRGELTSFARARDGDVYWAGGMGTRRLALTSTPTATFVRYLPAGAQSGTAGSSLTVATYPLADAYSTAIRRSRVDGMTWRRLAGQGVAVWSVQQPTSVYLAWRGTPSLVEIYAPTAAEARAVALSGRVRPVR